MKSETKREILESAQQALFFATGLGGSLSYDSYHLESQTIALFLSFYLRFRSLTPSKPFNSGYSHET